MPGFRMYVRTYITEDTIMTLPVDAEIELVNGTIIRASVMEDMKARKLVLYEGKERYKRQSGFIPFEAILKVEYK